MQSNTHIRLLQFASAIAAACCSSLYAQDWCDTHAAWAAKVKGAAHSGVAAGCPMEGACDTPSLRDASIPGAGTPFKSVRLHFVIIRDDNGTNPATTEAIIAIQLAQLNADYAQSHVQFVGGYHWVNSSQYRHLTEAEVDPMKMAHAQDPAHACNVFITDLSGISATLLGRGTFPWDLDALNATGGIIVDDEAFGSGQKTLTHELGHNLGLWHTHRGISDLEPACSAMPCTCACYELADGTDGDTTGDFASDTPPTPVNFDCLPPGGTDACSMTPWGPTQPENYMSYAPDSCFSYFTPQQAGRTHCWIKSTLSGWLTGSWGDEAKLLAADGVAEDEFGGAVAISGNTAVVGAVWHGDAVSKSGSAFVFVWNGSTWIQEAELVASDGAFIDYFGNAVAISGDTVVIGAMLEDTNANDSGAAYIFVRNGTSWSQQAKLVSGEGLASSADLFGCSVSISDDTVLVGARNDDNTGGADAGSAHVFVRSGGAWMKQGPKWIASDASANDWFGNSVAISGNTAVVGALQDNNVNGSDAGAAYVFVRNGSTWTQQKKLLASDGFDFAYFGVAVSISGETAVVGQGDNEGGDSGSASVFVRTGVVWSEQATLTSPVAQMGDDFGTSVCISGETVVVGSGSVGPGGAAFVFVRSAGVWTLKSMVTASDAGVFDLFGRAVSLNGDRLVVGAFYDNNANGADAGSAYVLHLQVALAADINGDGVVNGADLGLVLGGWGTSDPQLDLNGNGTVDGADLGMLLAAWT